MACAGRRNGRRPARNSRPDENTTPSPLAFSISRTGRPSSQARRVCSARFTLAGPKRFTAAGPPARVTAWARSPCTSMRRPTSAASTRSRSTCATAPGAARTTSPHYSPRPDRRAGAPNLEQRREPGPGEHAQDRESGQHVTRVAREAGLRHHDEHRGLRRRRGADGEQDPIAAGEPLGDGHCRQQLDQEPGVVVDPHERPLPRRPVVREAPGRLAARLVPVLDPA